MKKLFLIFLAAIPCLSFAQKTAKVDCRVAILSDTHFDMPTESDQYHEVKAINRAGKDRGGLHGVIHTGDMCDKADPKIISLFRQRYDRGPGEKSIHYDFFPTFGNHDVAPMKGRPYDDCSGNEVNLQYMDSVLAAYKKVGKILNVDPSSRSYSFNLGGVHFVNAQLSAGETSYCADNLPWIEADLRRYAADGTPVVYIQHYGFDDDGLTWWKEENRKRLFDLLDHYSVAGFFVGHAHAATLRYYRGYPIFQVNNGWKDGDGDPSFLILHIKDKRVTIENCHFNSGDGHYRVMQPTLHLTIPTNH